MTYNLTQLANADSIYKLVVFSNNSADGILLTLLLLAMFFVVLMALKKFEFEVALLVSSWISFILAAILVYAELVALIWALAFLALAAFTAFFVFMFR